MERRKRLNLKVKRDLQIWILKRMLLVVTISIFLALLILYLFSHREIGQSFYKAHLTIKHVSDLLLPVILAAGGVCLVAGFLFAIFFPQRIAGPIYRIEEDLKYVASTGDFTKHIRLRRGDRFHSLAQAANLVILRAREELRIVFRNLNQVEEALETGKIQEAKKKLHELREHLKGLKFD